MSDIAQRLIQVRKKMVDEHIDAWVIHGSDPHGSEYVASCWETRAWISGFTGSAGTVVITQDHAMLWVDSRYYIQGAQQIEGTSYTLQKQGAPQVLDPVDWLVEHLSYNATVGVVGEYLSIALARSIRSECAKKQITLVYTEDWFDLFWEDRPAVPCNPVYAQDLAIAGISAQSKIDQIRKILKNKGCSHTLVSSLDDIAWILNLRGSDITYNPVFLSYLLIGMHDVVLFSSPKHFHESLSDTLAEMCEFRPYEEIFSYLETGFIQTDTLYLAPEKTNVRIQSSIPVGIQIVEGRDISTDLKAQKSVVEIEGMRRAHVLDGLALVRLLAEIDLGERQYTEISIAERLEELRADHEEYIGPSFSPIAGFGAHGALAHYSATEASSVRLDGDNLLVLDTGGQYRCGTTDVTRTLLFGEPTEQMKRDYTLVLKGNLSLAAQRFPSGTCGYQLDVLARQYLWQVGFSYGHGTGHGVGFCLNVHEGPQKISPAPISVPLEPGVILSDEPGIYREGQYGIRIENLLVVQPAGTTEFGDFYAFDVLTLCPFERRLIDTALLSDGEKGMIDAYHGWVYSELAGKLSEPESAWLKAATLPL